MRSWAGADARHAACFGLQLTRVPLVRSGTRLAGSFKTFVAYRLPAGKFVAVHLRRIGTRKVTHKRAREVRMYGRESEIATRMPTGLLALLPAPAAGTTGGRSAEAQLRVSLAAFLAPLLKEGAAYAEPATIMHCSYNGRWEESATHWGHSAEAETPYVAHKDAALQYGTATAAQKAELLRFAAADWTPDALDGAVDVAAMVSPRDVDASAAADRAAELETLQHEWEEQRAKTRASAVIAELSAMSQVSWHHHSGVYDPNTHTRGEGSYSRSVPQIRLKTALLPDASDAEGRAGSFVVDIYALAAPVSAAAVSTAPQHCQPLFSEGSDAPSRYGASSGPAASLRETLNTLLERDSPNHASNARAWRELEYRHGRDPSVITIPGLLAAVEAQERAEAPQPPGLSVQLRPYQRQALRFMLDAENLEGAGHFWSELPMPPAAGGAGGSAGPSPDDDKAWFSPMLNRLTRERPARCAGGMLSSEMGLGKTVISLACVLAAPQAPAVTAAKAAAYAAEVVAAPSAAAKKRVLIPTHATLVVCAVSLVGQWCAEAKDKLAEDSTLKIHMYHGQGRMKDPKELAAFDLVVTTYQVRRRACWRSNALP